MAVPISLPIVRDGAVAYALTVLVRPESFESLIRAQDLPPGWVSGIVDGNGNFVARLPPQPVGTPSSQTFQDAVRRNKEGWYRGLTVEGRDTFSAHARSERNNWSIGLGIPADIVLAGTRRTALLIGMGALAAVAVAFGLAVVIGRRIVRPMVSLAALARTVGKEGAAMPVPHATVREVDDVALALKDADSAVRERQVLIQREKDALQASDRAKDQFIAMLSHELRNPLAALTSAASILQRRDVPADAAKEARQIIDRQLKHMSRMIEDLLDVSRIVVGKANLSIESLDLAELVSTVVAAWQLRQAASAQSIDVQTQSVHVRADRTRMEQIVSNLLDNAMKFSSPGNTIRVTVAPRDGAALLTVSDEGRGIAPTMLDRVFDIFVQEDQGLGRSPGGLGLGLALVKRLVELQGGRVSAVSNGIGRGSIFSVELPRAQPEQSTASRITPTEQPVRHVKRILVIDDNEDARQALCTLLELEGHRTYQAPDGGRGVDLARGARPDVALIDIGLPDIDGYEVARRIKAGSETGITLIALTGYGQTEDKNRALAAGFDAHLVKPISIDRLSEVLTAH
jgi:signal transduction histidine kinase